MCENWVEEISIINIKIKIQGYRYSNSYLWADVSEKNNYIVKHSTLIWFLTSAYKLTWTFLKIIQFIIVIDLSCWMSAVIQKLFSLEKFSKQKWRKLGTDKKLLLSVYMVHNEDYMNKQIKSEEHSEVNKVLWSRRHS